MSMMNTRETDHIMCVVEDALAKDGFKITGSYENSLFVKSRETQESYCIKVDEDV